MIEKETVLQINKKMDTLHGAVSAYAYNQNEKYERYLIDCAESMKNQLNEMITKYRARVNAII